MCNALSPEKAVIWSVLHGAPCETVLAGRFRYAPYQTLFEAALTLKAQGKTFNLDNFQAELSRTNASLSPKDLRALKRMLNVSPPPRIRDNANSFMRALGDIQSGQPVELHRFIN
ncbi:hypothetical protein V5T82_01805 [Magnetovibrio sp. PR-2]|uniref:hypothetical protein n=1 Tax=Magnetovibrio sp. PR-2 TaxID=3120356 RepID=UPI002FCE2855